MAGRGRPKKKTFTEITKQEATPEISHAEALGEQVSASTTNGHTNATQVVAPPVAANNVQTKSIIEVQGRKVKGSQTVWHDLFELQTAKMQKNMSYDSKFPELVAVDHQHFFHTVDSNGRPMNASSTIGGHFHLIEIEYDADQKPVITKVSGPMHWVRKQTGPNKFKKVAAPCNDYDDHTHEAIYKFSEEVKIRTINPDAVLVQTHEQQKLSAPAGIIG